MKDQLGLTPDDRIVGFLFFGYPAEPAPADRARKPPIVDWRGM